MHSIHSMYPEPARLVIDQRLRDADVERRRRLARHRVTSGGRPQSRALHLLWG
jgi:hypothetical protein